MNQIIHSLWTAPYHYSQHRINGGFKNKYYFYLSAVLSFQSFKKNIPNSTFKLVTDDLGASMLVDNLGLPYDVVDLKLNDLKSDTEIWSIGKLHAFQQDKPFLHVDLDAYLFKPINNSIIDADIVVCNNEDHYKIYDAIVNNFKLGANVTDTIYRNIIKDFNENNGIYSHNLGVFGGNNVNLINEYCERSLKLYEINKRGFSRINRSGITCIIEQAYLAYFLRDKNITPTYLLDYNWVSNVVEHINDANNKGFTHLVSESKRNTEVLFLLENRVKKDHSEYFEKLQTLKNKSIQIYDFKIK